MVVNAVSSSNSAPATTQSVNSLSTDQFLQLLTAQLKDQDPMNPVSPDQMLNQMAELSSVSALTQLNSNFATLAQKLENPAQVSGLLGRTVEWTDAASGAARRGTVTRLQMGSNGWQACIGTTTVDLSALTAVQ
jgi:flagellar basal-body rod modification protein FlgD